MNLTEIQRAYLPAIEWLIDGGRGTGRSTVLAYALIRTAMRHPGLNISIFDHHEPRHFPSTRYILRIIEDLIKNEEEFKHFPFVINHTDVSIRMNKP